MADIGDSIKTKFSGREVLASIKSLESVFDRSIVEALLQELSDHFEDNGLYKLDEVQHALTGIFGSDAGGLIHERVKKQLLGLK